MELKLEQLEYQQQAIQSVISVFKGQEKNTFDNACIEGIRSNILSLTTDEVIQNIKDVSIENGIKEETANIQQTNDLCIEMETGTGKTLVYIKTIFELYKHYGFTKFIILVPSVAIKEGVLTTLKTFEKQLEDIYNERRRINVSLEQIIDGKAVIQDCLERLEYHKNVVPQLLEKLRNQPDFPILEWVEEVEPELPIEVEPELPVIEEEEAPVERSEIPSIEEEVEGITLEPSEEELEVVEEVPVIEEEVEGITLEPSEEELEVVEEVPEVEAETVEELPSETIPVEEVPKPIQEEEIETDLSKIPMDDEAVTSEITEEELPAEAIEEIEEAAPVVTADQEATPLEEILPQEIPSLEELQQEFATLNPQEIHEAVTSGLSGQELREYLELRVETIKEDEASAISETESIQPTKTWRERIDIEQYPNMRVFLQAKQLKLTTTGRKLANLKRISEDTSREGQILIAEILELRDNNHSPEAITSLRSYLTDELSRWESENITEQQLPSFTRQRVLSFYVCYEQDIAELLEITMRYENLIDDESPFQSEYKKLGEQYSELIETL